MIMKIAAVSWTVQSALRSPEWIHRPNSKWGRLAGKGEGPRPGWPFVLQAVEEVEVIISCAHLLMPVLLQTRSEHRLTVAWQIPRTHKRFANSQVHSCVFHNHVQLMQVELLYVLWQEGTPVSIIVDSSDDSSQLLTLWLHQRRCND